MLIKYKWRLKKCLSTESHIDLIYWFVLTETSRLWRHCDEIRPLCCLNMSENTAVHFTFWTVTFEIISSQRLRLTLALPMKDSSAGSFCPVIFKIQPGSLSVTDRKNNSSSWCVCRMMETFSADGQRARLGHAGSGSRDWKLFAETMWIREPFIRWTVMNKSATSKLFVCRSIPYLSSVAI